jgi:hypothetical protein
MLGYITVKKAKELGFTHHGSYYGVPVYIGDPSGEFKVQTKHVALDIVFDFFSALEGTFRPLVYPDNPDLFQFKLGEELK